MLDDLGGSLASSCCWIGRGEHRDIVWMQRTNSWHDADASSRGKESATILDGNLGVQSVLTERQARNNSFSIG